ncbi:MAG: plastocyanin/azurin family copper-binding protein [Acidimicrobiia bacterium]
MTDTETLDAPEPEAEDAATAYSGPTEPAGEVPVEPARPRFWERPMVERYLVPLFLPVLVIGGIVMFILNISRIFLSSHDNMPVILGTAITLLILGGATVLAAAPRMRTGSLALCTAAFVFAVLLGGWLSLGSSEPEEDLSGPLPAEGPASVELPFTALAELKFDPSAAEATTGIALITLGDTGGTHTLAFEDTSTRFATLEVSAAGDTAEGRAFFGEAGDYVYYCTITGHREAGMEGVVTVAGDTLTLEQAEAAAAAAGGGEGGTPAEDSAPEGADPAAAAEDAPE